MAALQLTAVMYRISCTFFFAVCVKQITHTYLTHTLNTDPLEHTPQNVALYKIRKNFFNPEEIMGNKNKKNVQSHIVKKVVYYFA